jgi:hypothetical protein
MHGRFHFYNQRILRDNKTGGHEFSKRSIFLAVNWIEKLHNG